MAYFKVWELTNMPFATQNFTRDAFANSLQSVFYRSLSAADVAAEKAAIEAAYVGVGYNYEQQHDASYKVTLTGPADKFKTVMNELFPKNYGTIEKVTGPQGINIGDLNS